MTWRQYFLINHLKLRLRLRKERGKYCTYHMLFFCSSNIHILINYMLIFLSKYISYLFTITKQVVHITNIICSFSHWVTPYMSVILVQYIHDVNLLAMGYRRGIWISGKAVGRVLWSLHNRLMWHIEDTGYHFFQFLLSAFFPPSTWGDHRSLSLIISHIMPNQ